MKWRKANFLLEIPKVPKDPFSLFREHLVFRKIYAPCPRTPFFRELAYRTTSF